MMERQNKNLLVIQRGSEPFREPLQPWTQAYNRLLTHANSEELDAHRSTDPQPMQTDRHTNESFFATQGA